MHLAQKLSVVNLALKHEVPFGNSALAATHLHFGTAWQGSRRKPINSLITYSLDVLRLELDAGMAVKHTVRGVFGCEPLLWEASPSMRETGLFNCPLSTLLSSL